jgi:hypothetical protein
VINIAIEFPFYGQLRASNELKKKGVIVSSSGVRLVWIRNDLENFQKRLKALQAKLDQDNIILSKEQVAALEKAKKEKEAHGEIETYHPGFLGSQDSYLVGNIKGIGSGKKWGQTPIFLSIFTGNLVGNSDSEIADNMWSGQRIGKNAAEHKGKRGSDPDIPNRDKRKIGVRPRYS